MGLGSEKKLEVKKIFIGSPGDVIDERHIFRDIVEKVNKIKAKKMALLLEPIGWEDTLPGKGRPQEKINKDVKEADLVVLLLWRRWGTPTGSYSSGFEEEYQVASGNNKEIFLYFRDVLDEMLADPGDQLKKVLEFKDKIEAEKKYLYCRYESDKDFEDLLLEHLCRWLDGLPIISAHEESDKMTEYEERIERLEKEAKKSKTQQQEIAQDWAKEAQEHADSGRITKAEEYFAKALALYTTPSILNSYGLFLLNIGSPKKSKETLTRLLKISKETGDKKWEAITYGNIGTIHGTRGDLNAAELCIKKALALDKKFHYEQGMATGYGNLGIVYEKRGAPKTAEKMYKKALALFTKLRHKEGIANVFGNLGNIYADRGNLKRSEQLHKKALALDKKLGNQGGMAADYGNLGNVYLERDDLKSAENMYKKALALGKKLGHKERIAIQQANLGIIYLRRGDINSALQFYRKSLAIYKSLGNKQEVTKISKRIEELEKRAAK